MKIFCPIDFSEASLNALEYAVKFGESANASLVEISHCFTDETDLRHRLEADQDAEDAIKARLHELEEAYAGSKVKLGSSLFKGHPLDVIPAYIRQMKHDFIVVGTKGLTAVRDLTVGSFTEDLIFNMDTPIMVIPKGYEFRSISDMVLAIDDQLFDDTKVLKPLVELTKTCLTTLHIVHVRKPEEPPIDYLHNLDQFLDHSEYVFHSIPILDNISDTLNQFCTEHSVDLLCMVHRDRGWMINIFHRSKVKEKLFHLQIPLLVLQA